MRIQPPLWSLGRRRAEGACITWGAAWVAGWEEWVAGWQTGWATSNGQVAPAPIATRKASELLLKEFKKNMPGEMPHQM